MKMKWKSNVTTKNIARGFSTLWIILNIRQRKERSMFLPENCIFGGNYGFPVEAIRKEQGKEYQSM